MNPFDQFAGELSSALPQQSQQQPPVSSDASAISSFTQQMPPQQQQFSLMAQPPSNGTGMQPPPQQPAMNGMMQSGGQMGGSMYGGMGGQQQPPAPTMGQVPGGGMYGLQPQQQMMMPSQSMTGSMMAPSPMNGGMSSGGSVMGGAGLPPPMQQNQMAPFGGGMSVASGALVPSNNQSNPYALGPPQQQQMGQPYGMAPPPPQQQQQNNPMANPFGAPVPPPQQQQQMGMDPFGLAPPASTAPSNAMMPTDPWGTAPAPPAAPTQPAQIAADPWGAAPQQHQPSNALVPSTTSNDDPFGIFGTGTPAPPAENIASAIGAPPTTNPMMQQQQQPPSASVVPPPASDDPWADMGFGPPNPDAASQPPAPLEDEEDLFGGGLGAAATRAQQEAHAAQSSSTASAPSPAREKSSSRQKGELPPGGEWYDAKIFTPTLGVMFFKPKELVDSLFLQTDKKMVDALEERPVVAFIVEGSSARSAGVELGHVLLKVNGIDVKNPKEASRLIKEGPRPLPLLFYVPATQIVVAEGEHMVKYNTKETGAPNSAKDWKPKYCVIGGIIAQPWMMNMYRSKSEYDIAVIETQARRPISVKVKQFSLQGARIQNDWQGPQMVKYKNKLHPWKYIVILPVSRNPIKIASPNLSQLKPVHEGVRRVLQAQQRDRGHGGVSHSAVPVPRDPYRSGEREDERNGARRGGY
eukprot:scaffold1019_cov192-Alexandrium_tamarense.AAC.5